MVGKIKLGLIYFSTVLFTLLIMFVVVGCDNSTHVHNFTGWFIEKEASCEIEGQEKRICLDCDEVESRVTSKTEHNATAWVIEKEATCELEGKMLKRCASCRIVLQTKIIPKSDHTYSNNWVVSKEATCMSAGKEYRQCEHCSKKEIRQTAKINHVARNYWVTTDYPTCTEYGRMVKYCEYCTTVMEEDTTTLLPKGHTYISTNYTIINKATCTTPGTRSIKCNNCDNHKQESYYEAHNYIHTSTVQPTTTSKGYDERTCSGCQDVKYINYTCLITFVSKTHYDGLGVLPTISPVVVSEGSTFEGVNSNIALKVASYNVVTSNGERLLAINDTIDSSVEVNVYWTTEDNLYFDTLVNKIARLEELAYDYYTVHMAGSTKEDIRKTIDKQVAIYIRSDKYTGSEWSLYGSLDTGFDQYVRDNQGSYDIVSLKNGEYIFECPETNAKMDFVHMFATLSGIVGDRHNGVSSSSAGQATGWAGDLTTLVKEVKSNPTKYSSVDVIKQYFSRNENSFGNYDMNADLDADNIANILLAMTEDARSYASALRSYYIGLTEKTRRTTFYTSRGWGNGAIAITACKTQLSQDTKVFGLSFLNGVNITSASNATYWNMCIEAFINYLTEL